VVITNKKVQMERPKRGQPLGRFGSLLPFVGQEVQQYTCDAIPAKTGRQYAGTYRHKHTLRTADPDLSLGAALTRARALAELFGYTVPYGCPAVWGEDTFYLFLPPPGCVVLERFLSSGAKNPKLQWTRGEAKQLLCPHWPSFYHIGKIPPASNVRAVYDRAGPQLDLKGFLWSPRFGDDDADYGPDFYGPAAVPCAATTHRRATLEPIAWLVDSGSPLDIIDEKRTTAFTSLIRDGPPVILDTANGELYADKEVPLHLTRLGENICPMVLPSTPDVLSLGRRVIDDGYSFEWPAYSHEPRLTHPTIGEVIALSVIDYCPHLHDEGTTRPGTLAEAVRTPGGRLAVGPVAQTPRPAGATQRTADNDTITSPHHHPPPSGSSGFGRA